MTSGLKMLPSACGLGQHFQAFGHSFSPYGPPSRQITYISSRVKISCLHAKAHLVFHWCLYNKYRFFLDMFCTYSVLFNREFILVSALFHSLALYQCSWSTREARLARLGRFPETRIFTIVKTRAHTRTGNTS